MYHNLIKKYYFPVSYMLNTLFTINFIHFVAYYKSSARKMWLQKNKKKSLTVKIISITTNGVLRNNWAFLVCFLKCIIIILYCCCLIVLYLLYYFSCLGPPRSLAARASGRDDSSGGWFWMRQVHTPAAVAALVWARKRQHHRRRTPASSAGFTSL